MFFWSPGLGHNFLKPNPLLNALSGERGQAKKARKERQRKRPASVNALCDPPQRQAPSSSCTVELGELFVSTPLCRSRRRPHSHRAKRDKRKTVSAARRHAGTTHAPRRVQRYPKTYFHCTPRAMFDWQEPTPELVRRIGLPDSLLSPHRLNRQRRATKCALRRNQKGK